LRGPIVRLIRYSRNPYDLSVATARTCYSSKGIVLPEDVSRDEAHQSIRLMRFASSAHPMELFEHLIENGMMMLLNFFTLF